METCSHSVTSYKCTGPALPACRSAACGGRGRSPALGAVHRRGTERSCRLHRMHTPGPTPRCSPPCCADGGVWRDGGCSPANLPSPAAGTGRTLPTLQRCWHHSPLAREPLSWPCACSLAVCRSHHPVPSSGAVSRARSARQRALSAPSARGSAVLPSGRLEPTGVTKIAIAK